MIEVRGTIHFLSLERARVREHEESRRPEAVTGDR